MTTNKGTEEKEIGFIQNKNINKELKETFNIALLNRIDNIISFNNLTKSNITKIINNHIIKLQTKYKNININISKNIINELVNESEYQTYGARKIEKIIKNKLENIIIDEILENKQTINIDSIFSK
jgi:ATP-dependent Clp protease ATP-binding subunit ClpA